MLGKKSYLKETGGTVAVNFALGLTALVAVIGAAVDLSLINSQKSKMQNLADSTALAAAVSGNTTLAELQLFADEFVKSSTLPDANAKVMLNNGNVLVELTKEKNLLISKALPGGKADLFADSEVPLPRESNARASSGRTYNVALVLDTTSSMKAKGRMDVLKKATSNFLTALDQDSEGTTQVSLVPFSNYVRLPVSYADAPWLEVPTKIVDPDDQYSTASWEGCVNSRPDGFHNRPDFEGRRFQGFFEGDRCAIKYNNALSPLSRNYSDLNDEINGWVPEGATYIPSGLIWGWRTLSPNPPFEQVKQNPDGENIMILITDGSNTLSVGGGDETDHTDGIYHLGAEIKTTDRRASADALTVELCDGIKADGIRIITLTFDVSLEETRDLLLDCASNPDDYFNAENTDELAKRISEIENGLTKEEEHVVRLMR